MSEALQDYLNAIGRVPLLTPDEQIILGRAVQAWMADKESDKPCPRIERRGRRAMDRMVSANLRLVVSISRRFKHAGPSLSQMDLIQAGNLGLIRGVEKFDPERGYRCSTYLYWWIRQGISRHIDESSRTIRPPSTHASKLSRLGRIGAQLEQDLGRAPSRAELAEALGMKLADLDVMLRVGLPCWSLDHASGDSENSSSLSDLLAAPAPAEQDPEVDELHSRIAALDPIQQRLIAGRWGLEGPVMTFAQLAAQEAVSVPEARRMVDQAMRKLRKEPPPAPPTLKAWRPEQCSQLSLTLPAATPPAPQPPRRGADRPAAG